MAPHRAGAVASAYDGQVPTNEIGIAPALKRH